MTGLDWPALMKAGMGGLRLTPDQFWRLSPAELALMLGIADAPAPLCRAQLDDLLARYPDPERMNDG
ncbi:phage conserved hypothetical protein [Cognatiyoonia koreensis]|uniref:Phage tail assembly chaperone protein, TAC n=1 Tax=Cognatiyoonia koreensis TaxID=364200 RepID=A0A1I0NSN6_9RHOB|nr:rcc01693 family protein [Cognatiyoonia koreensis]SEW04450.1 phage conserved hypothetical protein [Cognatiyoonia koreensis]